MLRRSARNTCYPAAPLAVTQYGTWALHTLCIMAFNHPANIASQPSQRLSAPTVPCLLLAAALALAACGGGGGGEAAAAATAAPSTSTPPPATPPAGGNAPPAASTTVTEATSCAIPDFVQSVMTAVNNARAQARTCGSTAYTATAALAWNDKLFAAAAAHSADMAQKGYFSHTSQNGTTFDQRISNAGYDWATAGENIASGYNGVDSVMAGWLQSPGHCANIMNAKYKDIGVACVKSASGSAYWTMDLATHR